MNDPFPPSAAADRIVRGIAVCFDDDPWIAGPSVCRIVEDAGVAVADGSILAVGDFASLAKGHPAAAVDDFTGHYILPGFIDAHTHFPQTGIIGAYGAQLLDWLNTYTFPAEIRYGDAGHAAEGAGVFLAETLRHGVTTAMVFATSHPASVDALMTGARDQGRRMIAGKVMMDRNAPAALCDTPRRAYDETKALIARWHGVDRLEIAITPRFAITSTPEQLAVAGALAREHPGLPIQTHLSENKVEIATTARLYPEAVDYTDVYDRHGLLRPRAVFAHGIYLAEREWQRLSDAGAVIGHCPTSNLFLGSGLFDIAKAKRADRPVAVALATDVGGGTSFSMLRTMDEAYKVAHLTGTSLPPLSTWYWATLGNARALGLDDRIGRLAPGYEADLVVVDPVATPLTAYRDRFARDHQDRLFMLQTLGDDRTVAATYVAGRCLHRR